MSRVIQKFVQYQNPESEVGTPDIQFLVEWEYTAGEPQTMTDPGCEAEHSLCSICMEDGNGHSHDVTEMLTAAVQDELLELAMAPD